MTDQNTTCLAIVITWKTSQAETSICTDWAQSDTTAISHIQFISHFTMCTY